MSALVFPGNASNLNGVTVSGTPSTNQVLTATSATAADWQATGANGIAPVTSGFTCFYTGGTGNLLNDTSGQSETMVAGTIYYAAVPIPYSCTLTGIIASPGNTGTTDDWIAILYSSTGATLANSILTGTLVGAANTKQKFAFTSTYAATGPGCFFIGIQSNGTHANLLTFPNTVEGFVASTKTGNSFGTLTLGTPATTYTQNVGPFASTY
jgi:delta endotoxin